MERRRQKAHAKARMVAKGRDVRGMNKLSFAVLWARRMVCEKYCGNYKDLITEEKR